MDKTTHLQARVSPELAEQFQLAAQLDGRTASGALRHLARTYIATVASRNDDRRPEGRPVASDTHTLSEAGVDGA